ncbi:hypothetical protein L1987_16756 [Smallanthus sonchifolius]|uniref:Uncharacterized protein n=1 Tax=Smallanthus sonchifolius TaxID=185202 RepID=A0ACB9IWK2_9ASTR|nr:hypothetical protein L1987_16756 [Smallanthus sonchifolius]
MIVSLNLENKIISLQSLCVYLIRFQIVDIRNWGLRICLSLVEFNSYTQNRVKLCRKIGSGSIGEIHPVFGHTNQPFIIYPVRLPSVNVKLPQKLTDLSNRN